GTRGGGCSFLNRFINVRGAKVQRFHGLREAEVGRKLRVETRPRQVALVLVWRDLRARCCEHGPVADGAVADTERAGHQRELRRRRAHSWRPQPPCRRRGSAWTTVTILAPASPCSMRTAARGGGSARSPASGHSTNTIASSK